MSDHIRHGIVKLRRLRELRRFAGPDEAYRHNDFDVRTVNVCDGECANGHAHCQHLLLGAAVTLPVSEGKLLLGLWQRIFLVDLDRPRTRHYSLQVMGIRTQIDTDAAPSAKKR